MYRIWSAWDPAGSQRVHDHGPGRCLHGMRRGPSRQRVWDRHEWPAWRRRSRPRRRPAVSIERDHLRRQHRRQRRECDRDHQLRFRHLPAAVLGRSRRGQRLGRNGVSAAGARGGGITVNGGGDHRIRWNETSGNGFANPSDDYGIGIVAGNNNVIEANTAIGNTNGIVLLAGATNTVVERTWLSAILPSRCPSVSRGVRESTC